MGLWFNSSGSKVFADISFLTFISLTQVKEEVCHICEYMCMCMCACACVCVYIQ